ncbi:Hypothetical protein SMAX5B_019507 [Scophthalmus maximus]|uniref:Uncharacterized protein n=1 Tax=Scophthalmus maximus TaxID=52904 RepID=A0A2U9BHV4_SCOMX|nr:Hypothetical protein SMAX5B_019507 [Scophthalmus maximus]
MQNDEVVVERCGMSDSGCGHAKGDNTNNNRPSTPAHRRVHGPRELSVRQSSAGVAALCHVGFLPSSTSRDQLVPSRMPVLTLAHEREETPR